MMTTMAVLRFVHLVAAATWLGGMITLTALVIALARAGADRELLRVAARQFARVSWTAMAVAVITGLAQVHVLQWPWTYGRLHLKLTVVLLAIALAGGHQLTAQRTSDRVRRMVQGLLLLVSLAIFAVAVWI